MENTTELALPTEVPVSPSTSGRLPYEPPAVQTTQGALTALLGSAAECLDPAGDPPDLA